MKKSNILALLLASVMLLPGCSGEVIMEGPADPPKAEEPAAVTEIAAVDDFYGYVNLKKLDTLEIGYGMSSVGSFDEAADLVDQQVEEMLREIVESGKPYPKGSNEQLVHDMYQQYMATEGPSEDAEAFFAERFRQIDEVQSIPEYVELMAALYRDYHITLLFSPDVRMNFFEPDRYITSLYPGYYILMDTTLQSLIEERSSGGYKFAESVLRSQGVENDEATQRAKEIMFLFMDTARASNFDLYEDPLNAYEYIIRCSLAEADDMLPEVDLAGYFSACGAAQPKELCIGNPEALQLLAGQLREENLQTLKDYAKCKIVESYGSYLPDSYASLRGKYFPKGLTIKEDEALMFVQSTCFQAIDELYADRYMSDDVIRQAEALCEDMRTAYYDLIRQANWLSEEARALLCKKLENMIFMIGGNRSGTPDPADDIIGKDLLETILRMDRQHAEQNLALIDQPYDRREFGMGASVINACYDTPNTVTIPYGILHAPFFDPKASEAVNLGAIGSVIAHEMSHAFDADCIKFDMNGRFDPDWIPQDDIAAFEKKMQEAEDYYSSFTILEVYHVDGEKTLSENFADLGGMECILSVVQTDAEKQELMESYANTWCTLTERNSAIQMLHDDVHSPAQVRTNAVLSSSEDFYRIYGVQEGDGMYIPPEKRVRRW